LGQLALIAWQLEERSRYSPIEVEAPAEAIDLRRLSGRELALHLRRIGAW
jgi:hypothetical protein